jgi:hypothetical protein
MEITWNLWKAPRINTSPCFQYGQLDKTGEKGQMTGHVLHTVLQPVQSRTTPTTHPPFADAARKLACRCQW